MGHHCRVHCASTRRAHPLHLDTRLFKEPVEHTPSERAMGAAALESQIDALHLRDRWPELPRDRRRESFSRMRIYRHAHGFALFFEIASTAVATNFCVSTPMGLSGIAALLTRRQRIGICDAEALVIDSQLALVTGRVITLQCLALDAPGK